MHARQHTRSSVTIEVDPVNNHVVHPYIQEISKLVTAVFTFNASDRARAPSSRILLSVRCTQVSKHVHQSQLKWTLSITTSFIPTYQRYPNSLQPCSPLTHHAEHVLPQRRFRCLYDARTSAHTFIRHN